MTAKEFANKIANGRQDFIEEFFSLLKKEKVKFCLIGGLAVNVYAEPVVSLDVDIVIVAAKIDSFVKLIKRKFKVAEFKHSINITAASSDVRIQIQKDERYQPFIKGARVKKVLGYSLPAAGIEDVLRGKIWAYSDKSRRQSKRQKDLADIMRLVEAKPELIEYLPAAIKGKLNDF